MKRNPYLHLEQASRKDETCALHKGHRVNTETPTGELTKYVAAKLSTTFRCSGARLVFEMKRGFFLLQFARSPLG